MHKQLAKRVGDELHIPIYLYEAAQPDKTRSNLSVIRAGEYEGFFNKIKESAWKPDYGPSVFDARRGATVIGARDFLVAYNVNLNTTSTRRANAIAFDIREAGRVKKENGKTVLDADGKPVNIPGSLKVSEGDRMVYRRIWDCADFHQSYEYQRYTCPHCL